MKNGLRQLSANQYLHSAQRSTLPLRWHLLWLIVGALLPVVLFSVVIVYKLSIQEQEASERRALRAARSLAGTVEREVASTARALQALAASEPLDEGDFATFYSEAERVLRAQPIWTTVLLQTPEGNQILNARQPFGASMASIQEPDSLAKVVETQQPTLGDLVVQKGEKQFAFPVRVPVVQDDSVQYILTAVITPEALIRNLESQDPVEGEWTRTVVDGDGTVVARTRNPEKFVGQQGTPSFLSQTRRSMEGVYRDTTLEGESVYVAFSRMTGTSWTVAVTIPVNVIQGPTRQAMGLVVASGLLLLVISGVGAIALSRRISKGITSAALAAAALAEGRRPQVPSSSIREVERLGQSLEFSANLLAQREQERAEHLARAEAAREEAEAANRIRDEFLAVLSHELRSPLNPILGWAKLLQSNRLDEAKRAHALETIERNAKLQTQLIEDLLDISRILRGKLLLNPVPVQLVSIIESALETVRLAAEAKEIEVCTELDSRVGPVLGDSARLQQIMWNLLSNAVKFTPVGGRVEVRLERVDGCAQIQVQDNGKGINPAFLPHIFEYFRQEDGTTTRRFGGLGLGLAIVHHLTELHGGTIDADSPGEGLGATFTIRLPLLRHKEPQAEDDGLSTLVPDADALTGLHILLVDDDPDIRDIIAFVLEQFGAKVNVATSAEEGVASINQMVPDALVCDIGMPDVDGYQLMRQIRARSPQQGGEIPAIALTAYAGEINQRHALAAGFQRHMAKPVEPQVLVQTIIELLNGRSPNESEH